jgi:hypothetical protein
MSCPSVKISDLPYHSKDVHKMCYEGFTLKVLAQILFLDGGFPAVEMANFVPEESTSAAFRAKVLNMEAVRSSEMLVTTCHATR